MSSSLPTPDNKLDFKKKKKKAIDSEGVTLLYINHVIPHYGIP